VSGDNQIVFDDVSKFYGDVLGVNRVQLSIPPGITTLVGPNGSGKTTLMNLMTGLVQPTRGRIRVLGIAPDDPERLFRLLGYCTQFDSFPKGLTVSTSFTPPCGCMERPRRVVRASAATPSSA